MQPIRRPPVAAIRWRVQIFINNKWSDEFLNISDECQQMHYGDSVVSCREKYRLSLVKNNMSKSVPAFGFFRKHLVLLNHLEDSFWSYKTYPCIYKFI
jgi:hypothetical protein